MRQQLPVIEQQPLAGWLLFCYVGGMTGNQGIKTDEEAVRAIRDDWRKYAEAYAGKAHDAAHRTPIDYGSLALYGDRAKEANAGVRAIHEVMDELGIEK